MKSSAALSSAGLLGAAALLLTGCASAPTLDETWSETRQKVEDAKSVHLVLDASKDADESSSDSSASSSSSPFGDLTSGNADIKGATDGSHTVADMSVEGDGDSTMDLELLTVDGSTYMQMSGEGAAADSSEMQAFQQLVGDRWFKMPADQAESSGMSVKDVMDSMKDEMPEADAFDGKDLKAEEVELDGEKYLKYDLPEDQKDFADVMYVDPDDKSLYRLEGFNDDEKEDGPDQTTVTFTEWDAVDAPEKPADDEVFDAEKLQDLAG